MGLVDSYKADVERKIETSFDPVVSQLIRLSDLIALRTGDIKIMAPRGPPKLLPRIFVSRVKFKSKLSLEILDRHLLLWR